MSWLAEPEAAWVSLHQYFCAVEHGGDPDLRHEHAGNVLPIERERQKSKTLVSVAPTEDVGEDCAGTGAGFGGCEAEDREAIEGGETMDRGPKRDA